MVMAKIGVSHAETLMLWTWLWNATGRRPGQLTCGWLLIPLCKTYNECEDALDTKAVGWELTCCTLLSTDKIQLTSTQYFYLPQSWEKRSRKANSMTSSENQQYDIIRELNAFHQPHLKIGRDWRRGPWYPHGQMNKMGTGTGGYTALGN